MLTQNEKDLVRMAMVAGAFTEVKQNEYPQIEGIPTPPPLLVRLDPTRNYATVETMEEVARLSDAKVRVVLAKYKAEEAERLESQLASLSAQRLGITPKMDELRARLEKLK
jgi:hypothetical protein